MISEAAQKTDWWSREAGDGYNTGAGCGYNNEMSEAKLQLQEWLMKMEKFMQQEDHRWYQTMQSRANTKEKVITTTFLMKI